MNGRGVLGIGVLGGDRGGAKDAGGSGEGGSEGGRGAGGGEGDKEKSEAPWQRVISQLTSSNEGKFFDVWRIPGVRSTRQQPPNESVL